MYEVQTSRAKGLVQKKTIASVASGDTADFAGETSHLPSSLRDGPAYYQSAYEDICDYATRVRRPTLFITAVNDLSRSAVQDACRLSGN